MKLHNGKPSPPSGMAHDVSQVAHDVVELAELQLALAKIELLGWCKSLLVPAALVIIACVLAGSCVIVLLLSAAQALGQFAPMGIGLALCVVGCSGILVACVIAAGAWSLWKRMQSPFHQSKRELTQNVRWFKTSLKVGREGESSLQTKS